MSIGLDVARGPSSISYAKAAEAWPDGSVTVAGLGSLPTRSQSTMFPSLNVTAPKPLGELSERTNLLPVTRAAEPWSEIVSTRATPPGRLRNCQGGFTENGPGPGNN